MEHLLVHLAYEVKIDGSVQYRWMYPFERYLHNLKLNAKQKVKVEASIVNVYLNEEVTSLCLYYFEDQVKTRLRNEPRNYDGRDTDNVDGDLKGNLSIFKFPSRHLGRKSKRYWLSPQEAEIAHTYVLLNCDEIQPYIQI